MWSGCVTLCGILRAAAVLPSCAAAVMPQVLAGIVHRLASMLPWCLQVFTGSSMGMIWAALADAPSNGTVRCACSQGLPLRPFFEPATTWPQCFVAVSIAPPAGFDLITFSCRIPMSNTVPAWQMDEARKQLGQVAAPHVPVIPLETEQ
jgi:hypothetical protein